MTAVQESISFEDLWPSIDAIKGFLIRGQERWLYNAVLNLPNDAVIVEIGSFLGRSTTAMAYACRGTNRQIYAVDTFKGNASDFVKGQNNVSWEGDDYLETFRKNLRNNGLLEHVVPLQGLSGDIGKEWDRTIDFLFIDGSHVYEDVVNDFELFSPWVKPGALIALHDVQPQWEGPYRAWVEVVRNRLINSGHFFSIAFGRPVRKQLPTEGKVHVIVPVHNRWNFTVQCLKSLTRQTVYERMQIHVVDDGSTDGTSERLATEFPDVNVIRGDGNLWWTGAVAKAIENLRPVFAENDYFLLVNNDALLSAETVEVLMCESVGLANKVGRASVAPIAVGEDSNAISTGWGPGTKPILTNFERQFDRMSNSQNKVAVKSLFGRCSLYPVEILHKISNFDAEAFPHYFGDTDFCLTAGKSGYHFYVTSGTCIRVKQNQDSTGSHHGFRKGPQPYRKVKENMTSIKSIDNVIFAWRYMVRHHHNKRFRNTFFVAWASIKQWTPIYNLRDMMGRVDRKNH